MKLILASSNTHKAQELNALLAHSPWTVDPAPRSLDVAETGKDFTENAFLKAQAYYQEFQRPALSDDSGLLVDDLPDQLGVHSARFGGTDLTDQERCQLLLSKLLTLPQSSRTATFVSILCFYFEPGQIYFFEGRCEGEITLQPRGDQGFGYDPVFAPLHHPDKKTFAEDPLWKAQNSHRFQAARHAQQFFNQATARPSPLP